MKGIPGDPPTQSRAYGLDEIDVLRKRLDASYTEAQEALDATAGDVIAALAYLEQRREKASRTVANLVQEVFENARSVVSNGEVTSVKVVLGEQPIFCAPLALTGATGVAMVILSALLNSCRVEVAVGKREDEAH
ncbi:MAG: hypothetical protein ACUVX8_02445 [Candidatus Zipacnadales bacterium]